MPVWRAAGTVETSGSRLRASQPFSSPGRSHLTRLPKFRPIIRPESRAHIAKGPSEDGYLANFGSPSAFLFHRRLPCLATPLPFTVLSSPNGPELLPAPSRAAAPGRCTVRASVALRPASIVCHVFLPSRISLICSESSVSQGDRHFSGPVISVESLLSRSFPISRVRCVSAGHRRTVIDLRGGLGYTIETTHPRI